MREEKVKAFVVRILKECEQEGFTVSEALSIPQNLRWALNDCVLGIHESVGFSGLRVDHETSDKDADTHLQTL